MITTPIDIAAKTAIAIRIGTIGEEPPSLCDEDDSPLPGPDFAGSPEPLPEPWPGLPCLPVPPSFAVPDPPPDFEDEPPSEDPPPDDPPEPLLPCAVAPPFFLEECAEGPDSVGIVFFPVTVGGASEY